MSDDANIDRVARQTIQEVTGTPAEQLRGLAVQTALNDFIARQSAAVSVKVDPPSTDIKSSVTTFPTNTIRTNEQPLPITMLGSGAQALGPVTDVIMNDNGTLDFYTVNMVFTGTV